MKRDARLISAVVPVYNEEENIPTLYHELTKNLKELAIPTFEIIFVSDGSYDKSEYIIKEIGAKDERCKGIFLSKNYGHQFALKAGLDFAKGDVVVSLDGDMQHPPSLIKEFYKNWQEGFDIVQSIRQETKGVSFFKKISSTLYYKVINAFSDIPIIEGAADFRLIDKKICRVLSSFQESNLFMRGLVGYIGYKKKYIYFEAPERFAGQSKYSLKTMMRFAQDGLLGFSLKPLRFATYLGFATSLFSFANLIYVFISKFILQNTVSGWSTIVSILTLLGGVQLLCLGIIGEYVGRTFMEAKGRPQYIIAEKVNCDA